MPFDTSVSGGKNDQAFFDSQEQHKVDKNHICNTIKR